MPLKRFATAPTKNIFSKGIQCFSMKYYDIYCYEKKIKRVEQIEKMTRVRRRKLKKERERERVRDREREMGERERERGERSERERLL